MLIKFGQYDCIIKQRAYANGMIALQLMDYYDMSPVATATVFVEGYEPETEKHTLIKDYSENEGMLACLVDAGIVEDTGESVQSGYVVCPIVKVLI